jgi:hypothetical protein
LRPWLILVLASLSVAGCTSDRLRTTTIRQATTLTDLQYQQILNNLAMFSQNPAALPWHVNIRDGSAQVADLGALTIGGELTHTSKATPSLLGSRTVVEQWGMVPVTDDTELRLLRVAYRRALGYPDGLEDNDYELANDLAHEFKKQTADFNEFQDQLGRTFDDGKERHRNEQFQSLANTASSRGWRNPLAFLLFGNTSGLHQKIADVLFPYQYTLSLYNDDKPMPLPGSRVRVLPSLTYVNEIPDREQNIVLVAAVQDTLHFRIFDPKGKMIVNTNETELCEKKQTRSTDINEDEPCEKARQIAELKHLLAELNWDVSQRPDKDRVIAAVTSCVSSTKTGDYYRHLLSALSVINDNIIVSGEKLTDGEPGPNGAKKLDNYDVDQSLTNEYDKPVGLVTPFAAEIRRQVKDVAKDVDEIPSGWFHVGRKRDVPKDACYVGQYRDCYVWVERDGLEELTQFTIKILNFSSLVRDPTILTTPGPRFTPASAFPSP